MNRWNKKNWLKSFLDQSCSKPKYYRGETGPKKAISKIPEKLALNTLATMALNNLCLPKNEEGSVITMLDDEIYQQELSCQGHSKYSQEFIWCSNILSLLNFMSDMLRTLKQNPVMKLLHPSFQLIGSIVEPSRIGEANELDINFNFLGLQHSVRGFNVFDKISSAHNLTFTEEGIIFCHKNDLGWLIKNRTEFDYLKFLEFIMEQVKSAGLEIKKQFPKLKYNLEYSTKGSQCADCNQQRQATDQSQFLHCLQPDCLPFVTVTKRGICLIIRNQNMRGPRAVNTVDLCPIFEVMDTNVIDPMNLIVNKLIQQRPPNAIETLMKLFGSDRILSEWFNVANDNDPSFISVGMKFLHYGKGTDVMLVKPGQIIGVHQFKDHPRLLRTYQILKCLKAVFNIDLKSYMLKKLILRDEIKHDSETRHPDNLVKKIMLKNGIKQNFSEFIDFEKWKDLDLKRRDSTNRAKVLDYIPLTAIGSQTIICLISR